MNDKLLNWSPLLKKCNYRYSYKKNNAVTNFPTKTR